MTVHVNVSIQCIRNEAMLFRNSLQLLKRYDNYILLKNSSTKFQLDFYNLKVKFLITYTLILRNFHKNMI